ncbi:sialidase family protein [Tautonia rosea]|uniref:sialidase family protein n=1 Tax=Tautonia rosea TaxID=2728037 RepID=UPI00147462D1|nr:sialidase family protein [Tautonia rosea]
MSILTLASFLALIVASTPQADPPAGGSPTINRIFGPEIETGPYKHPACMDELANGDLYLVYYGGAGEYATDTAVYGSRLAKGSDAWTFPEVIAKDPLRSAGNGVIWQAPDGLVWLFYVVRFGETWSSSRIQFKVSRDGAQTWSDASILATEAGMMVRNRPIVLDDGSYLLPAYFETGEDTESVGPDTCSVFYRFDPADPFAGWQELGRIRSARGNLQPSPVQLPDGRIVAYCRRGGDYGPTTDGYIIRAESDDRGQTWTEGLNSEFPNPNAAVDFLKLQSGNLLLVYNDSMTRRTPLAVALSTDNDASYPHRRVIADGDRDYGYPIVFQARDGRIHLVFTSDRRSVVNHAIFDESWVLGQE